MLLPTLGGLGGLFKIHIAESNSENLMQLLLILTVTFTQSLKHEFLYVLRSTPHSSSTSLLLQSHGSMHTPSCRNTVSVLGRVLATSFENSCKHTTGERHLQKTDYYTRAFLLKSNYCFIQSYSNNYNFINNRN